MYGLMVSDMYNSHPYIEGVASLLKSRDPHLGEGKNNENIHVHVFIHAYIYIHIHNIYIYTYVHIIYICKYMTFACWYSNIILKIFFFYATHRRKNRYANCAFLQRMSQRQSPLEGLNWSLWALRCWRWMRMGSWATADNTRSSVTA